MNWKTAFLASVMAMSASTWALPADEPVDPAAAAAKARANKPRTSTPHEDAGAGLSSERTADTAAASSSRWPLSLGFHTGLTFDTEDPDVRTNWQHDIWYSYLLSLDLDWNFPKMFDSGIWLFAGLNFSYLHNEEQLTSDQANSYLHSNTLGLFGVAGLGWQPEFFNYKAGFQGYIGVPVWAQKSTVFESKNYTRNFGGRDVTTLTYGATFFYDIDHHWKPYLGYEYRVGSILTVGVNYAL
jgi:hypothetical protein